MEDAHGRADRNEGNRKAGPPQEWRTEAKTIAEGFTAEERFPSGRTVCLELLAQHLHQYE